MNPFRCEGHIPHAFQDVKERLHDFLERYRHLALARWGQDEVDRWATVSDADLPVLAERVHYQVVESLERENSRLRVTNARDAKGAQLSQEKENELARYRAKARDRSKKKINKRPPPKGPNALTRPTTRANSPQVVSPRGHRRA
jgi:hypothetical protein